MQPPATRAAPSTRWTSFEDWDYSPMKERLTTALATINKDVILEHAGRIKGQKLSMSDPFSAGQYWICFEMVAEDGTLIIARVRLPRHPDSLWISQEDESYALSCEVATMRFIEKKLPAVPVPKVYAYEGHGSELAAKAGAIYMLMEGFYGNTLMDVAFNMLDLPMATQEHIMTQWTMAQAQLATLTFPQIGSICSITESGEPVVGKLSTAAAEGFLNQGPFPSTTEYLSVVGLGALRRAEARAQPSDGIPYALLGPRVFLDVVSRGGLIDKHDERYPLNHMDLGTQNIIVDDDFNFLAVIDWEFAQTAPWEVSYYPFPFPLLMSDDKVQSVLRDPEHIAHTNVSRQNAARQLYSRKFREAEEKLGMEGRPLERSISGVLDGPFSRIWHCFTRIGGEPSQDEYMVREIVRLAWGLDKEGVDRYLERISSSLATLTATASQAP
ncbi:hypothetical protein PG990_002748 [Apiospora arundinis]